MTTAEQRRMIEELSDYVRKMKRDDQEKFDMFMKRNKDDEDLDVLSQKCLQQMYDVYITRKEKRS